MNIDLAYWRAVPLAGFFRDTKKPVGDRLSGTAFKHEI